MKMYARVLTANCDHETVKQHERKIRTIKNKVDFPVWFPRIKEVHGSEQDGTILREVQFYPLIRYKKKDDPKHVWTTGFTCQCGKYGDHGCCFMFPFDNWDQYKERISKFAKARTACGSSILHGDGCGPMEVYFYNQYGDTVEQPEDLWKE
jgi:hypothetical protein